MEGQNKANRRFDKLYEQHLPKLYNAALYLLGDREAAAAATERAWLQAVSDHGACDLRAFSVACTRLLLENCERTAHGVDYRLDEIAPSLPMRALELLIPLSRLEFGERSLVVLSAVQGFSSGEIARILRTPQWLVDTRLQYALGKLCHKVTERVAAG